MRLHEFVKRLKQAMEGEREVPKTARLLLDLAEAVQEELAARDTGEKHQ